jgi:sulfide:quinone oxidoreductase
MHVSSGSRDHLRAVIVGGGVGGLEAAVALRELAGDAVSTTLIASEPDFVYRPMAVREPFGFARANRYPLYKVSRDLGVELVEDSLTEVDAATGTVHTAGGRGVSYDALVLAVGTRISPRFEHAITLDDREIDAQLHGLIQDVEGGYVSRLAFVAPTAMPWPLPMYELALMIARRAYDMDARLSITVVTPEAGPLAVFGTVVSQRIERLLDEHGILTIPSAHPEVPEKGHVEITPGGRALHVDRIIALPQLVGVPIPGVPATSPHQFIPVDDHCRVPGLEHVWAAGDATDFPVKMGGIAAQQADTAATEIARLAGASIEARPFRPELRAILLGAEHPLYLRAQISGGQGMTSEISEEPLWSPPTKIAATYLAPYLDAHERLSNAA